LHPINRHQAGAGLFKSLAAILDHLMQQPPAITTKAGKAKRIMQQAV